MQQRALRSQNASRAEQQRADGKDQMDDDGGRQ